MKEIHNGHDIIDSRDVIARIAELEREMGTAHDAARAAWQEANKDTEDEDDEAPSEDFADWLTDASDGGNDDATELINLRALAEQGENYGGDWRHGAGLIRDSYFTEYAQELAEDIGAIGKNAAWPADCIDWEKAADALKIDYTSIDFDGTTYWIRS